MALASLVGVNGSSLGARFALVSLLPTSIGALILTFVLASGAPGAPADWHRAIGTADSLTASDVGLLALAVLVVSAALHPLQLSLVRLLEGYWGTGRPPGRLQRWLIKQQADHRSQLEKRAALDPAATSVDPAAAAADEKWRTRYPDDLLLPTGLGNALRAAEQRAGNRYGMDAITLWPLLYPLVSDPQRIVVNDRRDQLDLTARLTVTLAGTGLIAAGLLWQSWTWWWLPLSMLLLALLSYQSAIAAAIAYGDSLRVAFDLHHFGLLTALHLPLPPDHETERTQNKALSTWLRQGGRPPRYEHPPPK